VRCGDFRTSYAKDMAIFDTGVARWMLAAFLVVLFLAPQIATTYWLDVMNRIGIAIIAAVGLNILTGFTGQISLGNAAFLAVGAYTTAALAGHGLPFFVVIPLAGAITAPVGMIFGVPSLRLKGLYLAMATLAAHFVVEFTASP
jgi:branched-chain amino acid transport system permease protein